MAFSNGVTKIGSTKSLLRIKKTTVNAFHVFIFIRYSILMRGITGQVEEYAVAADQSQLH